MITWFYVVTSRACVVPTRKCVPRAELLQKNGREMDAKFSRDEQMNMQDMKGWEINLAYDAVVPSRARTRYTLQAISGFPTARE